VPRISAASVAEHVAQQRAAVFDAAVALFVADGYSNVSMGDIAAEVGLARNSLYRYFPDRAHILLEWFRDELPRQAAHSADVLSGPGTPHERIGCWAIDQLDYARQPEHALIASLGEILGDVDADTRAELSAAHQDLLAPLVDALGVAGVPAAERGVVVELIGGLVISAARVEGAERDDVVRQRLLAGIAALVDG
jgi:AcrR family transcriptional regulator